MLKKKTLYFLDLIQILVFVKLEMIIIWRYPHSNGCREFQSITQKT